MCMLLKAPLDFVMEYRDWMLFRGWWADLQHCVLSL